MLGIIGAGNMASALARGWGEPVLATDGGSGRAKLLVAELGGEALTSNAELARRADTIILGHKPHQLQHIASEIDAAGKQVFSVLGPTTTAELKKAFPKSVVARIMPNTPVQLRQSFAQDDYGNQTQLFNYGKVCGPAENVDVTCGNDEILTYTDYIYDPDRYIFDRPLRVPIVRVGRHGHRRLLSRQVTGSEHAPEHRREAVRRHRPPLESRKR